MSDRRYGGSWEKRARQKELKSARCSELTWPNVVPMRSDQPRQLRSRTNLSICSLKATHAANRFRRLFRMTDYQLECWREREVPDKYWQLWPAAEAKQKAIG